MSRKSGRSRGRKAFGTSRSHYSRKVVGNAGKGHTGALSELWLRKRLVIFLGFRFLLLTAILYGLLLIPMPIRPIDALASLIAQGSHVLLSCAGESSIRQGTALLSTLFSVNVARDCTDAEGICAFLAAVIATPVSVRLRLIGAFSGGLSLVLLNTIRVACLYATGIHGDQLFPLFHEKIWPLVMMQCNAVIFLLWLSIAWPAGNHPESASLIRRFLLRFLVIYGMIAILGPVTMPRVYEQILTMVGRVFECDGPDCSRTFEFSKGQGHPLNARITIVDTSLMNPDGSGPVRNVDFDALGAFWGPTAAFLSLTLAFRSKDRQRRNLFVGSLIFLQTVAFVNFHFVIWDEARQLHLPLPPPWVVETIRSLSSLSGMLAAGCLPFALWMITALDRRDISRPESRDNA